MRLFRSVIVIAFAGAQIAAAKAEVFSACTVQQTPDGFVALRDGPSPTARVIAKMHSGEIVEIEVRNNQYVRAGGWLRVLHYPGEAMPHPGEAEFAKVRRGWAKDKLVGECG